ncbi:MAG TPA: TolC family protein [Gammaproteobacteria bacterium]|nr:TolC family protein [Gammaproteobacteria bacterium]
MNSSLLRTVFFLLLYLPYAGAETLSLEQAIDKALSSDPRIAEKQAFVRHARAVLAEAEGSAGLFVKANSFVGVSPGLKGGLFGEEACGGTDNKECVSRDDRFKLNDGLSPWFYLEYGVIKPLLTFGKIENFAQAARHNIKLKEQEVRLQRGATILDVKRAYYGHLTARNSRLFLEDVKKRIDNAKEDIETQLADEEGSATQTDLYALQSAGALAKSYIVRAVALERIAIDGLKVLTGLKLTDDLVLADKRVVPAALPEIDLPALQARALRERPEMNQLAQGLKARRALVKARQAMKKPNLYAGVIGSISYSPLRDRIDNPHIADPFNDMGSTPIIGMQWEWAGGVQNAKISQARAELEALLEKGNFAQRGIPYQVSESYQQVLALSEALQEMRKSSKAARKWMVSSYSDFQAGLEQVDKLVTAFTAYVTTYTDYLKLVYEYNMQVAQLEQVTGAYQ